MPAPQSVGTVEINGRKVRIEGDASRTLLTFLRDDLDLTGTKYGCGEGQCGACTVLVDGKAVRSCSVSLSSVAGKRVTTIEGLASNGRLHPVQQSFLDAEAFQCGYCTPGMIIAATALLRRNANPSDTDIKQSMNGNICRCGTYPRIIAAVRMAAKGNRNGK